jgi:hypothetical protein
MAQPIPPTRELALVDRILALPDDKGDTERAWKMLQLSTNRRRQRRRKPGWKVFVLHCEELVRSVSPWDKPDCEGASVTSRRNRNKRVKALCKIIHAMKTIGHISNRYWNGLNVRNGINVLDRDNWAEAGIPYQTVVDDPMGYHDSQQHLTNLDEHQLELNHIFSPSVLIPSAHDIETNLKHLRAWNRELFSFAGFYGNLPMELPVDYPLTPVATPFHAEDFGETLWASIRYFQT